MNFDLMRMITLMRRLGDPQNYYPSVQIAGTNGKGSISALLHQILHEAGYRVGLYTSPHLERVNQRFQINGSEISDATLKKISRRVQRRQSFPHTEFEFLTAVAFEWFQEKKVDVAILEAGLGGKWDATNVVRHVLATVISNVDLDHTEWLGKTREKIAEEKAGIIKPNVPVITGAEKEALDVIRAVASGQNAPLRVIKKPFSSSMNRWLRYFRLQGHHQKYNAAIALETIRFLLRYFPKLSPFHIRNGLRHIKWPGRFEKLSLIANGRRQTLILDGAHNPAAAQALKKTLLDQRFRRVRLLFGVLRDKDLKGIIRPLAPLVTECRLTPVASERTSSAIRVAREPAWAGKGIPVSSAEEGLLSLLAQHSDHPILITGSLYLIGEIRTLLKRNTRKWHIDWA